MNALKALIIASIVAASTAQAAENGVIVALIDIHCEACKAFNSVAPSLERVLSSENIAYSPAPVPQSADASEAWPERTYYSVRDRLNAGLARQTLDTLFDAQDAKSASAEPSLATKNDVHAWLSMYMPQVRWDEFFSDVVEKETSQAPVKKAISLFRSVGARKFPAFVYIGMGKATLIETSGNAEQKLAAVQKWIKTNVLEKQ